MNTSGFLTFVRVLAVVAVCTVSVSAQDTIKDTMGRPMETRNYVDVKGSPFLSDEWAEGEVKLQNGNIYTGVSLKYDQMNDVLLFKGTAGQAQTFVEPVVAFKLGDQLFRRGYVPVDGAPATAFYEVLTDGKTQLLKRTTKNIFEELPYGSATKVKSFRAKEYYYLSTATNQSLLKLRKDKKTILQALSGQKSALEQYIKEQKLDLKQDAAIAMLVAYYNTL